MIWRLYKAYGTGKTLYKWILKPIYEELRKDAYALDEQEKAAKKKQATRRKKTKKASSKKAGIKKPSK